MVIAVDGNAYLGKTTYLSAIKCKDPDHFTLVQEYDTDLELLDSLPTHHDRQEYYFSLEEIRTREYGRVTDKTLLLDRSYVSILAHSWAMSILEHRLYFTDTLNLLYRQLDKKMVLIPDQYVFFLQKERERRYSDYLGKGSEDILYDYQYRLHIDDFLNLLIPVTEEGKCPIERMLKRLDQLNAEIYKND